MFRIGEGGMFLVSHTTLMPLKEDDEKANTVKQSNPTTTNLSMQHTSPNA
jgi:hypothetical protein